MATKIGAKLQLEGEKEFKAALSKSNDSLKVLGSELKLVSAEFDKEDKSVEALARRQDVLTRTYQEQQDKVKLLEQRLKEVADAFGAADSRTKNLQIQLNNANAEMVKTQKELEGVTGDLNAAEKGEDAAGDAAEEAGKQAERSGKGWESLGNICASVGKVCAEIGKALVTATKEVLSFVGDSVQVGMEFDSAMSQVAAISGAVGEDFDALRQKALEMGSTTKFSASESAEAMNYMAMAGWKTEDMLEGIEGIMSLAAASGESLGTTSDIVTDALTAFGMSAEESGRFADVLAAASANANTNVSMLGESFKYVAPVAGSLGYSVEDVSIALGLMANSGIKASTAGTSLRTLFTNMANPTSKMYAAMQTLGVSLTDDEGNMLSLMDLMTDLREGFGNLLMPVEEFEKQLATLDQALQEGKISEEDYAESMKMLMDAAYGEGALKAEAASMLAGKQGMAGLLAVVNASEEDFNKLTEAIYNSNGAALEMSEIMQDNLAGDITIFKSALEGAQIAISDEVTPALRQFVQFGSKAISELTQGFQEGGFEGLNEALGRVLDEGLQMLGDFVEPVMQAMGTIIQALISAVLENLPDILKSGSDILETLITGILSGLPDIVPAIVEVVMTIVDTLIDNLPLLVDSAVKIVLALVQGITEALPDLIPATVDAVLTIVDALIDNLDLLVDAAIDLILALAEGLIRALPLLVDKAPEIVAKLVKGIIEAAPKLFEASLELILKLGEGLANFYFKIVERGRELVDGIKEGFQEKVEGAAQWGKDLIQNFIDGILAKWEDLKSSVRGVAQTVKDLLGFSEPKEGPLSDFHTYAPDMMDLFIKGIRDNTGKLREQIARSFEVEGLMASAMMPMAISGAKQTVSLDAGSMAALRATKSGETVVNIQFTGSLAQLGRILQPEIQTATRLRGASLVN